MTDNAEFANGRILVIDDNPAIHQDFEKILMRDAGVDAGMTAGRSDPVRRGGRRHRCSRVSNSNSPMQGSQGVELAQQRARRRRAVRPRLHRHAHAARLGRARNDRAPVGRGSRRPGGRLLRAFGLRLGRLHRTARALRQTTGAEEALRADRSAAMRQRADAQVAGRAGAAPPRAVARTDGDGAHRGSRSRQPPVAPPGDARCADRACPIACCSTTG